MFQQDFKRNFPISYFRGKYLNSFFFACFVHFRKRVVGRCWMIQAAIQTSIILHSLMSKQLTVLFFFLKRSKLLWENSFDSTFASTLRITLSHFVIPFATPYKSSIDSCRKYTKSNSSLGIELVENKHSSTTRMWVCRERFRKLFLMWNQLNSPSYLRVCYKNLN